MGIMTATVTGEQLVDVQAEAQYNSCIRNGRALLEAAPTVSQRSDIPMTTTIIPTSPDSDNLKHCSKCGENKPLDAFSCSKRKADGRQPYCKDCNREYYTANHERISEQKREYYTANIEHIAKYQKEYHKTNIGNAARRAAKHRRRARKGANGGSFTSGDLAAIRAAQTDRRGRLICWKCGKPIKDNPHLDHWIPLDKEGANSAGNLHYMHAKCNLSKGAKHPHDMGILI